MTLLSALEDFSADTLRAVPGVLQRLRYVAGLRDASGTYQHWGLERIHGSGPARRAMAEAHSLVFLELLRTPLRQIQREISLEELRSLTPASGQGSRLIPANLKGGAARHFNSALAALEALARSETSRPAA